MISINLIWAIGVAVPALMLMCFGVDSGVRQSLEANEMKNDGSLNGSPLNK